MSTAGDRRHRAAVSDGTRERPALWRRFDLLVYVIGVTALIVYALHGFDGFLHRDFAILSYGGQQAVEGVPPYVGILNRAGPLAHLIPALGVAGARAGGFEDLLGIRLLFMLIAVGAVCVVYLFARELFASRLAGLAAAAAFLSFHGFIKLATYGPRAQTPMVLFLLCSLLAVAKQWWFVAGFSLSLATLVWQPVLLVGLAAALTTVIALRRSERQKALARFAVGGLVPASVFIIYFALAGALKEFMDGFLLINVRYTVPSPLMSNLPRKWTHMHVGYGVSLWVIVVGLAALVILTFLAARRGGWRAPARIPVAAVGTACFAAFAWSFRDFNSWPDAFVLLPMAAIGIGGIAKELTDRLPARAALVLCLAWVVAGVAVAATYSTTRGNDRLERQRDQVAHILGLLPSDASIQSIGAPEPLVLSGKRNPTRHQVFVDGLNRYIDDTWPGGLRGFAEWVGREQPTILSLHTNRVPRWLRATIEREYRWAGPGVGWTWYVHRSVAP
jgi:4-amino-4-deoxy-L-arabinose transferase-like glycosyltransferase